MESSSAAEMLGSVLPATTSAIKADPTAALGSAVTRASELIEAHGSSTWLGFFARLIIWILQTVSIILYYALKMTTISVPTLLFTLFSTSLTVTMNATTLWVPSSRFFLCRHYTEQ
jgi:lysophospholipid hydrolase